MSEANEERESLMAIFGPELLVSPHTLVIRVRVPQPFSVACREDMATAVEVPRTPVEREGRVRTFPIEFLPPITLRYDCADDYPEVSAPAFTLTCPWLTLKQLSKLCHRLDEIWEENKGSLVLFQWISFLQDETLDFLAIKSPFMLKLSKTWKMRKDGGDGAEEAGAPSLAAPATAEDTAADHRASQDSVSIVGMLKQILDNDRVESTAHFNKEYHDCEICYTEKQGTQCIRFEVCRHVFCRGCVTEHFNSKIADGAVKEITCPAIDCKATPLPNEIRQLVNKEMYDKYDRLLLQVTLDEMNDIVYCPRQTCQFAVVVDPGSEMGYCNKCQFSFCVLCKRAWHGVNGCKIEDLGKLLEQYKSGDPSERAMLVRKYGKAFLERACDEAASMSYLQENSQACPSCGAHISKTEGCNKMICSKCNTPFCWLCRSMLSRSDPYAHFREGSRCNGRLFDLAEIDAWEANGHEDFLLDDDMIEWEIRDD